MKYQQKQCESEETTLVRSLRCASDVLTRQKKILADNKSSRKEHAELKEGRWQPADWLMSQSLRDSMSGDDRQRDTSCGRSRRQGHASLKHMTGMQMFADHTV